jgi:nucleoside-diphosphate-sugar epimerase
VEAVERGEDRIVCWGSGRASREFLYVADCAEALVLAMEKYDSPDPLNVGTGCEITIRELTERIARLAGFAGEIAWDAGKPDGQPRRQLDVSRIRKVLGWQARTEFEEGLRRTVEWYRANR